MWGVQKWCFGGESSVGVFHKGLHRCGEGIEAKIKQSSHANSYAFD